MTFSELRSVGWFAARLLALVGCREGSGSGGRCTRESLAELPLRRRRLERVVKAVVALGAWLCVTAAVSPARAQPVELTFRITGVRIGEVI